MTAPVVRQPSTRARLPERSRSRAATSRNLTWPLVVVSQQLPYDLRRRPWARLPARGVDGLVTALEPVLSTRNACWVGWDGAPLPSNHAVSAALALPLAAETPSRTTLLGVPMSERDVSQHDRGFCNRSLWPLFHGFPGRATFDPAEFEAYERVNRRFAEVAMGLADDDGTIWIHGFQLLLVPRYLKRAGFEGRILLFLHIPFPSPEIFRVLPWSQEVLRSMTATHQTVFQIPRYRDNFAHCAVDLAGAERLAPDRDGAIPLLTTEGVSRARAVPVGIAVEELASNALRPEVLARAQRIRDSHPGRAILLGVDELDFTKGIHDRLRSVARFLKRFPESAGRFVLVQIVMSSRHDDEEHRALKRRIESEVGRINGEHGRDGWMPIHYRYGALDRGELIAHYRAADVAVVTPLRDGMNLIASEFVASRSDGDGVLIVSELAGAAESCPGAIFVNPYDVDGCVRALKVALEMEEHARRERMGRLRRMVGSNPVLRWADRCLLGEPALGNDALQAAGEDDLPSAVSSR